MINASHLSIDPDIALRLYLILLMVGCSMCDVIFYLYVSLCVIQNLGSYFLYVCLNMTS